MMEHNDDAYLDQALIGGLEPGPISVVDYDERWALRFHRTAERVRQALGGNAVDVEHIGSTSVPGLAAKPIVDILVTVDDVTDEAAYLSALESIGFVLRGREPKHRMLRTPEQDVHLHVYEPTDAEVKNLLDLRDWLRIDEADRELYATTKRQLATQRWSDMNHYAEAKTEVVLAILGRARAWRAGTPPRRKPL